MLNQPKSRVHIYLRLTQKHFPYCKELIYTIGSIQLFRAYSARRIYKSILYREEFIPSNNYEATNSKANAISLITRLLHFVI